MAWRVPAKLSRARWGWRAAGDNSLLNSGAPLRLASAACLHIFSILKAFFSEKRAHFFYP